MQPPRSGVNDPDSSPSSVSALRAKPPSPARGEGTRFLTAGLRADTVLLLGQLAGDKDFQKQGHAASLLLFALKSALRASEIIGSMGVITHPLDGGVRGFHGRWGFQDLPFDPRRAMMVRMVDVRRSLASDLGGEKTR